MQKKNNIRVRETDTGQLLQLGQLLCVARYLRALTISAVRFCRFSILDRDPLILMPSRCTEKSMDSMRSTLLCHEIPELFVVQLHPRGWLPPSRYGKFLRTLAAPRSHSRRRNVSSLLRPPTTWEISITHGVHGVQTDLVLSSFWKPQLVLHVGVDLQELR